MSLTAQTVSNYEHINQDHLTCSLTGKEQVKWSWLMWKAKSKHAEFLAYYDDNQLVGFSYVIHHHHLDFLFFLAVNPNLHSQARLWWANSELAQRQTT
ncbi:N-acetyltransferase [Limosilactobacillus coleohominis]|uniref:N-acetyltransferase n=1 Tax=Limosilactobacillus coleohominis TaxID=181675 RepID=UPI000301CAA4|nr:N-acetyltransferase [Limosilactobacillus coleohominis]